MSKILVQYFTLDISSISFSALPVQYWYIIKLRIIFEEVATVLVQKVLISTVNLAMVVLLMKSIFAITEAAKVLYNSKQGHPAPLTKQTNWRHMDKTQKNDNPDSERKFDKSM